MASYIAYLGAERENEGLLRKLVNAATKEVIGAILDLLPLNSDGI